MILLRFSQDSICTSKAQPVVYPMRFCRPFRYLIAFSNPKNQPLERWRPPLTLSALAQRQLRIRELAIWSSLRPAEMWHGSHCFPRQLGYAAETGGLRRFQRQPVGGWWITAMKNLRSSTHLRSQEPRKHLQKVVSLANSDSLCFYSGKVHGGLLATILDEAFAEICSPAVTASLNVTYKNPTPPGGLILVEAWLVKAEGRKLWVEGCIRSFEHDKGAGTILVQADALFTVLRSRL